MEELWRKNGRALYPLDFSSNGVEALGPELEIKVIGFVFDIVKIVLEPWLPDEIIQSGY
jgi:hypothetical protein